MSSEVRNPYHEVLCLTMEVERLTRELVEANGRALKADWEAAKPHYPTQWAYDQACKALEKHRERADEAEAALARVEALCDEMEHNTAGTAFPALIPAKSVRAAVRSALSVQEDQG